MNYNFNNGNRIVNFGFMSLNKVSTFVLVFTTCTLLVAMPQINNTAFASSTITSKFLVFTISCLVITGCFLPMVIFSKSKTFQISKLDIGLFLLVSYIIINRYFIQPEYGFSIRFFELMGLSVLYFVLRNLPVKAYLWFLIAIVISGSIQAVYGNLQFLGYYSSNHSGFKLTGSFFNPGPYAGFIASVFPVSLAMYLFKEKIITQIQSHSKPINKLINIIFEYIPFIGIISIVLVLPATQSRGAWLAVIVSSFFLIEFKYRLITTRLKELNVLKRTSLVVLTVFIIGGGLFGGYHFKKRSSDGRLFIWKVTTEIIKDNPVSGVGFDRFKAHYMNYQAHFFAKQGETEEALVADNSYYAFNEWLQFISEEGIIGLLLLIALIVSLFMTNIKIHNEHRILFLIAIGCFLSIGIFAFFSYPLEILPIKLILVVLLGLLINIDKNKYSFNIINKPKQYLIYSLKIVTVFFGILGLIKGFEYTKNLEHGFKTWQNGLTIYQYGDYQEAIEAYKEVYPILKKDGDFLMNYGKALAMNQQNIEAVQILEEAKQYLNTTVIETALGDAYKGTKQYKNAEKAYQHAANMIPVRFYPLYLQAKLYEEIEERSKAIAMAKTILNKEIKIPSTAIKEIKAEMKRIIKNNEEASIIPNETKKSVYNKEN